MPAGYEPYDFLKDTYEYSFFKKKNFMVSFYRRGSSASQGYRTFWTGDFWDENPAS